jgi:hypothetical protein
MDSCAIISGEPHRAIVVALGAGSLGLVDDLARTAPVGAHLAGIRVHGASLVDRVLDVRADALTGFGLLFRLSRASHGDAQHKRRDANALDVGGNLHDPVASRHRERIRARFRLLLLSGGPKQH